jgi:hypothetical protein
MLRNARSGLSVVRQILAVERRLDKEAERAEGPLKFAGVAFEVSGVARFSGEDDCFAYLLLDVGAARCARHRRAVREIQS